MDDPSYTVTPIPLSRLVDEGFSEKDRLGMAKYIDPDIHYAWLYRDDEKRWKHVDRELVDIDTIVEYSDSDYTSTSKYSYTNLQTHRVGPNPKTASIRGDIETNGWAIDVLPPAVEQVVDGEGNKLNFRLDGATRITLAKSAGVPNMLVDKFIVEKPKDKVRLGLIYNTYQKPFGEGSIKDVTNGVQKMVNQGMIDFSCREMGYDNFSLDTISATDGKKFDWVSNVIKKEMNMVSSNKIRGADLNNAVIEIVNEASGVIRILNFPRKAGLPEYLFTSTGLNLKETKEIKIDTFSGGEHALGKFSESIYKHRDHLDASKDNKVQYIFYVGTVDPSNALTHWENSTIAFAEKVKQYMDWIKFQTPYGNQVSILGAVPQVLTATEKYPMGELSNFSSSKNYVW